MHRGRRVRRREEGPVISPETGSDPGQESGREKVTLPARLLPEAPGTVFGRALLPPARPGAGPAAGRAECQLGVGWSLCPRVEPARTRQPGGPPRPPLSSTHHKADPPNTSAGTSSQERAGGPRESGCPSAHLAPLPAAWRQTPPGRSQAPRERGLTLPSRKDGETAFDLICLALGHFPTSPRRGRPVRGSQVNARSKRRKRTNEHLGRALGNLLANTPFLGVLPAPAAPPLPQPAWARPPHRPPAPASPSHAGRKGRSRNVARLSRLLKHHGASRGQQRQSPCMNSLQGRGPRTDK